VSAESPQGLPFLSGGLWFWLLLLGGGFSFFGATTTVFGGFGGRSPLFWANAPVATKQPIATAIIFRLKSNIEFPVLLMLFQRAWEGELRDAPPSSSKKDASNPEPGRLSNPPL
jgi:hypothetical protein